MKFINLPDYLEYENFMILEENGAHNVCTVTFKIAPRKAEAFLLAAEQRVRVEIASDSGDRIMEGVISAVTVDYGITLTTAEVCITSESLLLQEKGKNRIFQNPHKTYADILESFPEVEIGKCENLNDTVEEILYQYQVDDFTFLKYLAAHCKCGIWITEEGKVSFGEINSVRELSDSETIYQNSILKKKITASKQCRKAEILTMEQFPNGSKLILEGTEYVICGVCVYEKYDKPYFRYTALTKPDYAFALQYPAALYTEARVTCHEDPEHLGRIQVEFSDFQDEASEKTWIPYLTPYVGTHQGGVVALPDVDDHVIVCLSDGAVYAINSIRKDVLPENCCDVGKKHFAIKDSLMTADAEAIRIAQGVHSVCTLTADAVTAEHDKSRIALEADAVSLQAHQSAMQLTAEQIRSEVKQSSLTLKKDRISAQNQNGVLELNKESAKLTGGRSGLLLKDGKTKLSGNSIDLSTQGVSL